MCLCSLKFSEKLASYHKFRSFQIQIELVVERMEAKRQENLAVFEWFKTHVIAARLEPSIEHQELVSRLILI